MMLRWLTPERLERSFDEARGVVVVLVVVWLVGTLVLGLGRELAWLVEWM